MRRTCRAACASPGTRSRRSNRSIRPGPPSGGARIGLAFLCDSPADVDRVYAELTGLGYEGHKEPWDAFWGQRYALIRDPDGNSVDLFAPNTTR